MAEGVTPAVVSLSGAIRIPMGSLVGRQRGVVAIERRAIRAHILNVLAHVAENMRMVLWWHRADTHEFLGADHDDWNAGLVMEVRNDFVSHGLHTYTYSGATRLRDRAKRKPRPGRPGLNGLKAGGPKFSDAARGVPGEPLTGREWR
jgi:hypothetical protein